MTINYNDIQYAMLGTTHCTNAIVERKRLNNVAIIRIGKPATQAIEPLTAWGRDLKDAIGEYAYIVSGGYECDGRKISDLHEKEILDITQEIKGKVDSVAVVGVFSPVNAEQKQRVGEIITQELGEDVAVSLSYEIGSLGLLERENATILNGAIIDVAKTATTAFCHALEEKGIQAKLFFGQNDGTLMSVDYAIKYPILTIACGPTRRCD
jgi:N-methylhydantoinase A/oxoprolinase/acetone carboxylase beta subunit